MEPWERIKPGGLSRPRRDDLVVSLVFRRRVPVGLRIFSNVLAAARGESARSANVYARTGQISIQLIQDTSGDYRLHRYGSNAVVYCRAALRRALLSHGPVDPESKYRVASIPTAGFIIVNLCPPQEEVNV